MTGSRDDMVMRPSFGPLTAPDAAKQGREDRRFDKATDRRSLLSTLIRAQAGRRIVQRRGARRTSKNRVLKARRGVAGAAGIVGGNAARAAVLNPIGLITTGLLVGAAVSLRLLSGQSFEGLGARLNNILLGDLDDEARAKIATRRQLASDSDIARIVGKEDGINSQIFELAHDLNRENLRREKGISRIREDERIEVNSLIDILILRAKDLILNGFNSAGGQEKVTSIQQSLAEPAAETKSAK